MSIISEYDMATLQTEWQKHLTVLPRMQVYALYKREYQCWRSMRLTHARRGLDMDPALESFPRFLHAIGGPMPTPDCTIDRVDYEIGYTATNLRWANKKLQARNRRNVVMLTIDGIKKPLVQWAEESNQSIATLRARHRKGLSDREILFGPSTEVPSQAIEADPIWQWTPWPRGFKCQWEAVFQQHSHRPELRVQFYLRIAEERLQELSEIAPTCAEEPADPEWLDEEPRWRAIALDAKAKLKKAASAPNTFLARHPPPNIERRLLREAKRVMSRAGTGSSSTSTLSIKGPTDESHS